MGVKKALSFSLILLKRSLIFFLYIFPIQKRRYCRHFQWSLPFISQWYFRSLSGIQSICILVPLQQSMPLCELSASCRCSALGSYGMNESTRSASASHPADNFHVAAGEEFSKSFSSPICGFTREIWGCFLKLSYFTPTLFYPIECLFGILFP